MRVWTVQPVELYDKLKEVAVLHADFAKSEYADADEFRRAYDWLADQMRNRVGSPPPGVTYPFWAWHTLEWKHKKLDLRTMAFRYYSDPSVCMELEIPDDQVLLSDVDAWNLVLNDAYIGDATNQDELDEEWDWIESLPDEEATALKRQSWDKALDVSPFDDGWTVRGSFIQATFWELRLDDVRGVRYFQWPQVS